MGGCIVVPTLNVLISPEARSPIYEQLGLGPGFDRTFLDYLEGVTGAVLQANLLAEGNAGYTLGVSWHRKGIPVLNIDHLNQKGLSLRVKDFIDQRRDPSVNPFTVDLNELTAQSRRGLVKRLFHLVSNMGLGSLILVNTDSNFVNPRSFEQRTDLRLVPRHVGQGDAFPCIVGQMLLENSILRLP